MNTQPFNSLRFDFINLVIFLAISTCCYGHENQQYSNCRQAYSCGTRTLDLKYPFWGDGLPEFCGRRGFELKCQQNQNSIIEIENTQFLVLGINAEDHLMNVTSLDMLLNGYCGIDLNHLRNITLSGGSEFFTFSRAMRKLSIFYGCTDATTRASPNNFTCDYMGSQENGFYVDESFLWNRLQNITNLTTTSCKLSVDVPVLQSSLEKLSGLQDVLNAGFELAYDMMMNCSKCVQSGGLCGSDPTTRNFVCHCHDRTYPRTCQVDGSSSSGKTMVVLVVAIAAAGLVIIFIYLIRRRGMSLIGMLGLWKKERPDDQNNEVFMRHYRSLAPKYRYSDIAKMTNSFNDKIGQGGFGSVYKGKLNDGRLVAVKVLSKTKGNGEEFINEVASISRTSHVNVVALLGFCFERKRRALVYDFMANGSLDKFIHNDESQSTKCHLKWRTMYQITVGIARGLEYLHRGCSTRIVHFDIKPHNILLDEDFCPKISDFGLAKLCQRKQSIMSMLGTRGTIGYIAPELFSRAFGGVSHKSDVYSYGMLILEMSGASQKIEADQTSEIYFPNWIYEYLEQGNDLSLRRITSAEDEETARKMILVGLWCIQTNPSDRPAMSKVLEMLEGSIQSLQIPPKPFISSPTRSAPCSQDSSMSSPTMNHVVEVPEGRLQSIPIPPKPPSFAPSRPHQTS